MSTIQAQCHDLLFQSSGLSKKEKLAREKDLADALRHEAFYPARLNSLLGNFAHTMADAAQSLRWGKAQYNYYEPSDKSELVAEVLDKTYRMFADRGDYTRPQVTFGALPEQELGNEDGIMESLPLLGYYEPGLVALSDELKNRSIEELFMITTHECCHGLVRDFGYNCVGLDRIDCETPGYVWSRMAGNQNSKLYTRLYYACAEEALVRQAASHAVGLMSSDPVEILHCQTGHMDGYEHHRSASDFRIHVETLPNRACPV
jgi:hypothetical protein